MKEVIDFKKELYLKCKKRDIKFVSYDFSSMYSYSFKYKYNRKGIIEDILDKLENKRKINE